LTPVSYPTVSTGETSIRFLPPAATAAPLQTALGSAPTPVQVTGLPGIAGEAGGQPTPAGLQGTVVRTPLSGAGPAPSAGRRAAEQDEEQRRQAVAELRRLRDELRNEKGGDGTRDEAIKALERTIEAVENGPAPAR
jgi:hypothetical protein